MWEDAKDLFGRISTTIRDKMSEIRSNITDTWNNIMNWLRDLRSKMVDIGKHIIQGLIDGIKSLAGNVMDAVKGIANNVTSGIKNALKISSPSRVLMQLGEYTGEGFVLGLEKTISAVRQKAAELAAAASNVHVANSSASNLSSSGSIITSTRPGTVTQYITINSPTPLTPSEVARQIKNASRRLAMEW